MIKRLGWGIGLLIVLMLGAWMIYRGRQWDEKGRLTLINFSKGIVVESIDPIAKSGVRLILPDNLQIASVAGRGEWLASAIKGAGEPKWVADSVASYLGVAYDGLAGELGWWDWWQWNKWKAKVSWQEVKLEKTDLVEEKKLPDGLLVWLMGERWALGSQEYFTDNAILAEGISLVIVNSTNTIGMGTHAARFVESRGIRVAQVRGSEVAVDGCEVEGNAKQKITRTAKFLLGWFGCTWKEQKTETAELVLTIGKQYRKWWAGE